MEELVKIFHMRCYWFVHKMRIKGSEFESDKETLFQRVQSAIISATKEPKYVTVSSVKLADLLGTTPPEIERYIQELVQEGRLKKRNPVRTPSI